MPGPPGPNDSAPYNAGSVRRDAVGTMGLVMEESRPDLPRVFCVSMQRSGTTSVGDWLEAHGFRRAGWPLASRLGWTRSWLQGDHDAIFAAPEFHGCRIFEDSPWWYPGFFRIVADRFPEAKFILLTRDPADWFESLCHHSGGMNPGNTDVHARVYGREEDLRALIARQPGLDARAWNLLSLVDHADHYQRAYLRHTEAVQSFFTDKPGRLFAGRLDAADTFDEICRFVGVPRDPAVPVPRSNRRTSDMAQRLETHRASWRQPP